MKQKTYLKFINQIANTKYIQAVEKPYQKAIEERNKFYSFIRKEYRIECFWAGGKFHVTYPSVEKTNHFSNESDAMTWLCSELLEK